MLKKLSQLSLVALVFGFGVLTAVSTLSTSVSAAENQLCTDITEGLGYEDKVDTAGDPATVEYTAPAGFLVDAYCVKAGTEPVIVQVVPPSATVTIDHPNKDSVSHYQVHLIPVVASASVSKTPATCEAGEILVYGTATNATYDEASTENGTTGPADYNVTAIADEGFKFANNETSVTFTGTLSGPLTDASCDDDGEVLGDTDVLPNTSGSTTATVIAGLVSAAAILGLISVAARSILTRR